MASTLRHRLAMRSPTTSMGRTGTSQRRISPLSCAALLLSARAAAAPPLQPLVATPPPAHQCGVSARGYTRTTPHGVIEARCDALILRARCSSPHLLARPAAAPPQSLTFMCRHSLPPTHQCNAPTRAAINAHPPPPLLSSSIPTLRCCTTGLKWQTARRASRRRAAATVSPRCSASKGPRRDPPTDSRAPRGSRRAVSAPSCRRATSI